MLPTIFDRNQVKCQRNRFAAAFSHSDFLLREMCARLADRLLDVKRQFPRMLDLGAHNGVLADYLKNNEGSELCVQADISAKLLTPASKLRVVADEQYLPFKAESFDLVASVGTLQWVNDVPGSLIQINHILKPGGLFLAMLPGGETLKELRASLEAAEVALSGGIRPRIAPFIDVRDGGALLQRAKYILPVSDSEIIRVLYADPWKLLQDLRFMGQSNALQARAKNFTQRRLFDTAMEYYQHHFSDEQGHIIASFEMVTLTGWKDEASR